MLCVLNFNVFFQCLCYRDRIYFQLATAISLSSKRMNLSLSTCGVLDAHDQLYIISNVLCNGSMYC